MYNSARMIGVTIGIIVGLIIAIFIIRYVNRNKKLTTEYDEMQKQIRGEGYKYLKPCCACLHWEWCCRLSPM